MPSRNNKQTEQFYRQRGFYRVCSYGPDGQRIYAAWFSASKYENFKNDRECISLFKTGSDADKQHAAEQACNDHRQQQRAAG